MLLDHKLAPTIKELRALFSIALLVVGKNLGAKCLKRYQNSSSCCFKTYICVRLCEPLHHYTSFVDEQLHL